METITIEDVIAATEGKIITRDQETFSGVSTDSRSIQEGELFVALRGKNFDGHDYMLKALDRGNGAVVDMKQAFPVPGKTIIAVHDTLRALQDIAHHMRMKRDIPVIAITGSNGKKTTKELVATVLGTEHEVLKNSGNLNNQIGLPLSLTKIRDTDTIVVLEMGASAPGDIRDLCAIAAHSLGVLTNINATHLESFKDLETIRKTKLELLGSVTTIVANADELFLMEGIEQSGYRGEVIKYGIKHEADIRAVDIRLYDRGSHFQILFKGRESIDRRTGALTSTPWLRCSSICPGRESCSRAWRTRQSNCRRNRSRVSGRPLHWLRCSSAVSVRCPHSGPRRSARSDRPWRWHSTARSGSTRARTGRGRSGSPPVFRRRPCSPSPARSCRRRRAKTSRRHRTSKPRRSPGSASRRPWPCRCASRVSFHRSPGLRGRPRRRRRAARRRPRPRSRLGAQPPPGSPSRPPCSARAICRRFRTWRSRPRTRRRPNRQEFTIKVDAVITALGQESDWCCLTPECACTLTEWGTMKIDSLTLQSDDPGIFTGGDAARGPKTVIEAIADGRQAAISINRYLSGENLRLSRDISLKAIK